MDDSTLDVFLIKSIDKVIEETVDKFFLAPSPTTNSGDESQRRQPSGSRDHKTQTSWIEKSQFGGLRKDRSQYESTMTDKTEYDKPRNEPAQNEKTWDDKSQYKRPTQESATNDKSTFQTSWNHVPQHSTPRENNTQDSRTERVNYNTNSFETPRHYTTKFSNNSQYSGSGYQPSREEKSQSESFGNGQSQNLGLNNNKPQHQPNKSEYVSSNSDKHDEKWTQDHKRPPIMNVGKFYGLRPPRDEESQESVLDKYEKFRSQRKPIYNQNKSNKNQNHVNESNKSGNIDEVAYKAPNSSTQNASKQFRDVKHSVAQPSGDSPQPKERVEKQSTQEKTIPETKETEIDEETVKKPQIVSRSLWGALPTMTTIPTLTLPADTVVFSLNTSTSPCDTPKECMRRVREVQARHMGEGLGDIQYSYLVGGDGYIYEGRGVDYESGAKREPGEGSNINIAFIGRHKKESMSNEMLKNAHKLVTFFYENGLLNNSQARLDTTEPSKPISQ